MDDSRASPSAALLSLVRSEYGLAVSGDERDLGGSYNLNLLVAGSFVVRVYGSWVSAERVAAVQGVREGLRLAGWPIAPLRRALSGADFVAFGQRVVEVETYVDAGSPMASWDELSAGLPWLARLHDALRCGPCPPAVTEAPVANHLFAARVHEDTEEAFAALRSWVSTATERRYLAAAEQLVAVVAEVDRFEVPAQLVHGDFWHNNVILDGSRLVRLGDFDFLGVRPRVDDLALTLFFANEHHGRDDLSQARIDQLRRLVDRYDEASEHPLTEVERAALPYAIARTPLTFVRDLADGTPFHRQELVDLRGPEYEWALRALDDPRWLSLGGTAP
ncbi:phosphotransferase enzyme family protein [Tenggerimyces flavus]|uniref:Phosphotransferase enzyme family protein n=1 Tax=Tenggerimyces flavus TaxID=1708749 RepID=A0ABV7Y8L0_9ACTN|nr:phosphotransferase [Tenggerimyces flavus]MBM7785444.1 homoserine kinase type II [Tenggerimyces flavus]